MVAVRLLGLPRELVLQAYQHRADLLAEAQLVALAEGHAAPPPRLAHLLQEVLGPLRLFVSQLERDQRAARTPVRSTVELRADVPVDLVEAAAGLSAGLAELDLYCRHGQHLLTVPASDTVSVYSRWLLSQYEQQAAGSPAGSWSSSGRLVVDLPAI